LCDRNGRQRDIHFTGDFSKAGTGGTGALRLVS
jgi:hypothetical protein